MNKYIFEVSLCEGYSCGTVEIEAGNEDIAYDKALDYVCKKLADALPELDIAVFVELMEEYL